MAKKPKAANKKAPDALTETKKEGEVELKEDDLKRATGGALNYKLK